MRHRKKGRVLGRSPSHRKAMLRNLASSLFLTERDAEFESNPPKVKGRIVTTLQKAKEVRPLVEKCVTIARNSLRFEEEAEQYAAKNQSGAELARDSDQWRQWRSGADWKKWVEARAPVVTARRRVLRMIGDKEAVRVLFDEIAPRFKDRDGGYTRVLRLAQPRLGDAGTRAILEFVGSHDRVVKKSEKPEFSEEDQVEETSRDEDQESLDEVSQGAGAESADQEGPGELSAGEDQNEVDSKE